MWLQIIYFQFSTLHQQIYLFNILHSPYSKHYAPLYSGVMLDKGDLHLGNQRGPIISWETHLLWSVFHCCLLFASTCVYTIWWSTFHGPSQLGEERKILHWPPRDSVCRKREWKANWNDFSAYYYCCDCTVCHIIMPVSLFFFLFALKAPVLLLIALASLRHSLANKAPWNWKVNWNWMEGGDSLSLSPFFSAAGKAGLGLAQKETKGSMHACVFVFGCVHMSVCRCVPALSWSQGSKVFRGLN